MDLNKKLVDALVANGIDRKMAESMAKTANKPKKERKSRGFAPRVKVQQEISVILTCTCCGRKSETKKHIETYEESPANQQSVVGLCIHCIKDFYDMPKEQLISLIVIQNQTDIGLRKLGTKTQINLAKRYTPQELFLKIRKN